MHEHDDRVAITGLGVLSPIGVGQERFWAALCEGISGIRALPGARSLPSVGAQLIDYLAGEFVSSARLRRMDKASRAVVAATKLALADAGVDAAAAANSRSGIVIGTALGNIDESVHYLERLFGKGPSLASPMMFPNLVLNAAASYAAMETGSTGINFTLSDGEVSAEQALALAIDVLRNGRADFVLAGGVDVWSEIVVEAYRNMRVLAGQRGGDERCRPFDAGRNGLVLGEGAGMLVLEPVARARDRGCETYAVVEAVTSFGIACSPYAWPRALGESVARLRSWLAEVLPPGAAVDLVCTNANGSRSLDGFLLGVLTKLFGESAANVALTSVRGATGEFGAAGALSLAAAALALRHQTVPPLCAIERPPADSAFQFVAGRGARRRVDRVLHFSVARGGSALAVLLCRADW